MTVIPAYVDIDAVKRSLSASSLTYLDEDLEASASAASEGIDLAAQQTFMEAEEDTRVFTTSDPHILRVDAFTAVTTLKVDRDGDGTFEETWDAADFILGPVNAATWRKPYTTVEGRRTASALFPTSPQTGVQIVADFGWPETPAGVLEYAQILCEKLVVRKRQAPMGFVVSGDAAAYIARSDPAFQELIGGLMPQTFRSLQLT